MLGSMRTLCLDLGIATFLLLGAMQNIAAQAVVPVPQLDLKKFVGSWYEVMHYPDKSEKNCVQQATVLYAPSNKPEQFSVVRSCQARNETTEVKNFDGRTAMKGGSNGALKLRTIWPFYAKYSVIALSPDYAWAVLGSTNHKTLSVLSRTPSVSPEALTQMKQKAAEQGFKTDRLLVPPSS